MSGRLRRKLRSVVFIVLPVLFGAMLGTGIAVAHTVSPVNAVSGSNVYQSWHSEPDNWPLGPGAHQYTAHLNLWANASYPGTTQMSLNYYWIHNAWSSQPSDTWYEMFWIYDEMNNSRSPSYALLCVPLNTTSHTQSPGWSYSGFNATDNAMFVDQFIGRNSDFQSGSCGSSPFPTFHRSWIVAQPY